MSGQGHLSGNSSWSWKPVFPLAVTTLSALPPVQDYSPGCAEAMGWEGSGVRVRPAVGRRLLDTLTLRDRETHAVEEMMRLAASSTARGFYGPGKPACSRDPAVRTADHFGLYSPQQRKCCHSVSHHRRA